MMKERIGVVAEGITDLVVLNKLLPQAVNHLNSENFIDLQPSADRTSIGSTPEGGWGKVQKWCMSNNPKIRKQIVSEGGLFENSEPGPSNYDSILVQLDTDICEDPGFQKQSTIKPIDYDLTSPVGRCLYTKAVISEWLWPEGDVGDDGSWTIIGPSVEAIETWLIAGLTEIDNPEEIKDLDKEFVKAVFHSEGQEVPVGAKTIAKNVPRYEKISDLAAENIINIIKTCPHFSSLVDDLSNL